MDNILYIGLSGLAGSGKDTVAKALSVMLSHNFASYNDFINYYNENIGYETKMNFKYATFGHREHETSGVICVAFADRLKQLCSVLFGVPVDRFYYNKENAYICVNKDFEYTECKPSENDIVTAEQYYNCYASYNTGYATKKYMSLRDALVYIGTYVIQENVNRDAFINSVNNEAGAAARKSNIKYVICTDVRFQAELDYVKSKHGITIRIERPDIEPLDNIAENSLDTNDDVFDFIIDNDGSYDDLFRKVWGIIHDNDIFANVTYNLNCRDNSKNYVRKIGTDEDGDTVFELCCDMPLSAANMSGGMDINMVDPQGGPMISVGLNLPVVSGCEYAVKKIWASMDSQLPAIYISAGQNLNI